MNCIEFLNIFKIDIFLKYKIIIILYLFLTDKVHMNTTLNLAVLSPWSHNSPDLSLQATAAVVVALEDIYNTGLLSSSYRVNWTWKDSWCLNPQATIVLDKLYSDYVGKIHGIIGEGCSSACQTVGLLGASWNVPVVSYSCLLSTLSNKMVYPTFARVGGSTNMTNPIIKYVVEYFNWTRIAIVSDTSSVNTIAADSYASVLQSSGNIVYRYTINTVFDTGDVIVPYIVPFLRMLNDIKEKARGTHLMNSYRILFKLKYCYIKRIF